jgi:FkbM family methyltransferase
MPLNSKELEAREPELVGEYLGRDALGFFVEVGANDPRLHSQTWHLEQRAWRGVLVEPLPDRAAALRRERPNSCVIEAACSSPDQVGEASFHVGEWGQHSSLRRGVDDPNVRYPRSVTVHVLTLDAILEQTGTTAVDFVSMDTEGTELDALRGFDLERWKPRLLLIEDKVHSLEKHRYLTRHGYRLVKRTGFNNWYIPAGAPRPRTTLRERWNLVRKMHLATPWRVVMLRLRRRRAPGAARAC